MRTVHIDVVAQPDGTEVVSIDAFGLYSTVPPGTEPERIAWCLVADWFGQAAADECSFIRGSS